MLFNIRLLVYKCFDSETIIFKRIHLSSIKKTKHLNSRTYIYYSMVKKGEIYSTVENIPSLWNLNNGLTLCEKCHASTDDFKNRFYNGGD